MNFLKESSCNLIPSALAQSQIPPHAAGAPYWRSTLFIFVSALLSLLFLSPAAAQAPDASAEFFIKSPEPDKPFTVGDQIPLRLEITHPVDSQVTLPELEEEWGDFEVIGQTATETIINDDGTATTGKDIIVTLFIPGQYQTPPLVLTHRQQDGTTEELATPVIPIQITSVLTEDLELRDLKPQVDLPLPPVWPMLLAIFLGVSLLSGLIVVAALWLYNRLKKQPALELMPVPVIDTRPPEVIAYAELDRIEALNLPAQNRIKEHYSLVSDCLRRYIEGRYQIPALEHTTSELRSAFRKSTVPMAHVSSFMSMVSESDLVKFARYVPQTDDVNSLTNRARVVVKMTTPQVEEALVAEPEVVG